jgi:hypothetical protein
MAGAAAAVVYTGGAMVVATAGAGCAMTGGGAGVEVFVAVAALFVFFAPFPPPFMPKNIAAATHTRQRPTAITQPHHGKLEPDSRVVVVVVVGIVVVDVTKTRSLPMVVVGPSVVVEIVVEAM